MEKILRIQQRKIYIFVVLFLLMMPQTLQSNDIINLIIYQGSIAFASLIVIYGLLKDRKYWFISAVIILRFLYSIAQIYSTKLAGYSTAVDKHDCYVRLYTLIIFTYFIFSYRKQFIVILSNLLIVFLSVNIMSIVFTKNYLTTDLQIYFLGYRYAFCPVVILALALSLAIDYSMYQRLAYRSWFTISISIATVLIEGPSTLAAGLFAFLAFSIAINTTKNLPFNLYWPILLVIIVVDISITIFNSTGIFAGVITNILHRDMSFTGRTEVWAGSIQAFLNSNIWFGNGSALAAGQVGWSWVWEAYYSEHNHYLGVLTNGGIVGLALEGMFYILIINKINKRAKTKENTIFAAAIFSVLVMGIATQIIPYTYMEILCLITYHLEVCFNQKSNIVAVD